MPLFGFHFHNNIIRNRFILKTEMKRGQKIIRKDESIMKVISVVNRKGGVGKTTLTANLANEIANMGYKTLAVDLDSQADLSKIVRPYQVTKPKKPLPHYQPKYTLEDVVLNQIPLQDAVYKARENLYGLAGSENLTAVVNKKNKLALRKALGRKDAKDFQVVLIDHPPAMNRVAQMGFLATDSVLIVTDPDFFSSDNITQLVEDIKKIKSRPSGKRKKGKGLKIAGILLNRFDTRRNLNEIMREKMDDIFGGMMFPRAVHYNTAIPSSLYYKIMVRELIWYSPVNFQIREAAKELLNRNGLSCQGGVVAK